MADNYQGEGIPVFLINGFLESGKTSFIQYTMNQDYFKTWKTREEAENYLHGRTDSSHDRDTPLPFSIASSTAYLAPRISPETFRISA